MNKKVNLFVNKLKKKNLTLALAESVTCGLATHKLSTCKGTSDILSGSIICYTPKVKKDLMQVSKKKIKTYTCESKEVTEELAKNLSKIIKADIHAAITGLASKGGTETKEKPVGTIFYSIRYKNKIYNEQKLFRGSPLMIREKACITLYDLIIQKLLL